MKTSRLRSAEAMSRATTPASTWVARVPAGDSFTPSQLEWIKRAVRNAETISGLTFSLFVGVSEEDSARTPNVYTRHSPILITQSW